MSYRAMTDRHEDPVLGETLMHVEALVEQTGEWCTWCNLPSATRLVLIVSELHSGLATVTDSIVCYDCRRRQ